MQKGIFHIRIQTVRLAFKYPIPLRRARLFLRKCHSIMIVVGIPKSYVLDKLSNEKFWSLQSYMLVHASLTDKIWAIENTVFLKPLLWKYFRWSSGISLHVYNMSLRGSLLSRLLWYDIWSDHIEVWSFPLANTLLLCLKHTIFNTCLFWKKSALLTTTKTITSSLQNSLCLALKTRVNLLEIGSNKHNM